MWDAASQWAAGIIFAKKKIFLAYIALCRFFDSSLFIPKTTWNWIANPNRMIKEEPSVAVLCKKRAPRRSDSILWYFRRLYLHLLSVFLWFFICFQALNPKFLRLGEVNSQASDMPVWCILSLFVLVVPVAVSLGQESSILRLSPQRVPYF